ncbi:hypothetical protein PR202_ga22685 [Eleusine coracana subsp. coracana]|uniref:F-box domain-containing protein n=1 Tax=Eleusine coracana subsp. coracana TaxID=191504 RepID=A0AAV5D2D2_ELECO|nr:hypothetical protein PR202_ga22685 [Eleusine coracana subsp. coracana]
MPARSLAASRCVCKAWHAIVDEQQLLLRHLLPHSVRGLFVNFIDHDKPHFFARLTGDHRRGESMVVCNPTTRRWARLPHCGQDDHIRRAFIVFDPAVSLHYEVLLAPVERWMWHVLSSTTNRWEERVFIREGEAAESVVGPLPPESEFDRYDTKWRFAVYWQGALYVHCHGEFVSRLSLSNATSDEDAYDSGDDDQGDEEKDIVMMRKRIGTRMMTTLCRTFNDADVGDVSFADFLGFHPYKEIIFLSGPSSEALAYHLNDRKVQYLGVLSINTYSRGLL